MAGWEEEWILELGKKAESQQMVSGSQQEAADEAEELQMQPKQILVRGMRVQTQWLESLGSVGWTQGPEWSDWMQGLGWSDPNLDEDLLKGQRWKKALMGQITE
jgi:hypothetical protein